MGGDRLATQPGVRAAEGLELCRLGLRVLVVIACIVVVLTIPAVAAGRGSTTLPLAMLGAKLKVRGDHLVGSAKLVNRSNTVVPQTTGYLALRPSRGSELTGIAGFSVPSLPARASSTVRFGATVGVSSSLVGPGAYTVLVCRDVDSQIAKFRVWRNCAPIGRVSIASPRRRRRARSSPPHTVLTSRPPHVITRSSAELAFASSAAGSRFQCRLDGGPWVRCRSPVRYDGLVDGRHDFEVRAFTRAGVKERAPARSSWLTAMLSSTPYMGWNPYYGNGGQFNEQVILSVAQALLDRGLARAGYRIIWLDFGWASGSRDPAGNLIVDPGQWPHGLAWLTRWLHARGLEAGIYTDAGPTGCRGIGVGSLGHYQQDVDQFASWGFDAVKLDFCGAGQAGLAPAPLYAQFAAALASNSSRRPMLLDVNNFWTPGQIDGTNPSAANSAYSNYQWAPQSAQSWRTDTDIGYPHDVEFGNVLRNLDDDAAHPEAAGPGHWNDPDYLAPELGMSYEEAETQMSMWAIVAAPLILSNDPRTLTQPSIDMLENPEVIAIDQDPLGVQGRPLQSQSSTQVWVKPLADGDRAVALFNRGPSPEQIATTASAVGLPTGRQYQVRDVWQHTTTTTNGPIDALVQPEQVVLYRAHALPPKPKRKRRRHR